MHSVGRYTVDDIKICVFVANNVPESEVLLASVNRCSWLVFCPWKPGVVLSAPLYIFPGDCCLRPCYAGLEFNTH